MFPTPKHVHTSKEFVEAIIKKYDLKDCEPIENGTSWGLKAYWTDQQADEFCALYGVSGVSAIPGMWIFRHLKEQPYNPQIRF